jgi:hypothetical protein
LEFDPRRAEELKRAAGNAERRERKERVRSRVEEWGALQQGTTATDPMTGVRYEFKGEYLRPLSW